VNFEVTYMFESSLTQLDFFTIQPCVALHPLTKQKCLSGVGFPIILSQFCALYLPQMVSRYLEPPPLVRSRQSSHGNQQTTHIMIDVSRFPECVRSEDFAVLLGGYLFRSNNVVSVNLFEPGLKQSTSLPDGYTHDEFERLYILLNFVCCLNSSFLCPF